MFAQECAFANVSLLHVTFANLDLSLLGSRRNILAGVRHSMFAQVGAFIIVSLSQVTFANLDLSMPSSRPDFLAGKRHKMFAQERAFANVSLLQVTFANLDLSLGFCVVCCGWVFFVALPVALLCKFSCAFACTRVCTCCEPQSLDHTIVTKLHCCLSHLFSFHVSRL